MEFICFKLMQWQIISIYQKPYIICRSYMNRTINYFNRKKKGRKLRCERICQQHSHGLKRRVESMCNSKWGLITIKLVCKRFQDYRIDQSLWPNKIPYSIKSLTLMMVFWLDVSRCLPSFFRHARTHTCCCRYCGMHTCVFDIDDKIFLFPRLTSLSVYYLSSFMCEVWLSSFQSWTLHFLNNFPFFFVWMVSAAAGSKETYF